MSNFTVFQDTQFNELLNAIKKGGGGGGGSSSEIYSTTEQEIGSWIDGKPLYEIVIPNLSLNLLPTTAWQEFFIDNIDLLNVDKSISIQLFRTDNNNLIEYIPRIVNFYTNNNRNCLTLRGQGQSITDQLTIGLIILKYTKTTD